MIQTDVRCWDFRHQVLATRHMAPWRVLLWVKSIELIMLPRPRASAGLCTIEPLAAPRR